MKYKSKKTAQCLPISKNSITVYDDGLIIFPESFSNEKIKFNRRAIKKNKNGHMKDKKLENILKHELFHNIKIIKTLDNKYYICFVENIIPAINNNPPNVAAGDTGGRTLITMFGENGTEEYGINMNEDIGKMINERDGKKRKYHKMIKCRKQNNNNAEIEKRYLEAKYEYRRVCEKIKNKITDMHYKVITKLVGTYTEILVPRLNVSNIMKKKSCPLEHAKYYK